MILKPRTPHQALNKAYLKVKPHRTSIERFKANLIALLDATDDRESEEHHKNNVTDFFKKTWYDPNHFINTKGRNDLVIHNGSSAKSTVGVIIEAKKPTNKGEMMSAKKLNSKAFQELVLYYLRERITHNNLEVRHLVATNINEWFIFNVTTFDRLFAQNKMLVQQFTDFEAGRLADNKTDFFYKSVAQPFIEKIEAEIEFTYFDIRDYDKPLRNNDRQDDNTLIALYKLLSPEHLLNLPFTNDSNSLDKRFYSELLHIIGLTETKEGGKKLIGRNKSGERHSGSVLEDAIIQLDSLDKIGRMEKPAQFGATNDERLFNVALELSITWINRILFLKLLEAQLITYHKGDRSYAFLNTDKIKEYDNLDSLFFQVLARQHDQRNDDVKIAFGKVPYLNSSLFEPTDLEHATLFMSNLKDDKKIPIISSTVLRDKQGKKRTGQLKTLEYLFEFLDAYDFSSEGSEDIQEDNKTLINASVLGLIFEKINGYKDGSFFTPGFITMYMCRETIRKAVVQKFNEAKGWSCTTIDDLYDRIEDRAEANKIVNSLRLCDPAVGSGHFLVSALNEMIAVKNDLKILQDRDGKRLKEYHVEVVNDELIVTDEDGGLFEYNPANKESQRIQETLFHEKQAIIEGCLFGVDINPNSVKICRLRLWIELLKNAYYKGPSPLERAGGEALETLPNIDINIKCGNSLVSRFAIDADLRQALKKSKWTIDSYRVAVDTYRNAQSKEQKREMERLIADIKADFRSEISLDDPKAKKLRKLSGELFGMTNQQQLFEMGKKEKADWDKRVQQLAAETRKLEAEIEEIKANKIYENAFEWRFEFPEVLNDDGDFVGFDVVIGNPPYGLSFDEAEKKYLTGNYEYLVERIRNSYLYFIGLGLNLVVKNGYLNYIVPNEVLFQIYMTKARNYFLNAKRIEEAINLGDNVFEDAIVPSAILKIKNSKEENGYNILIGDFRSDGTNNIVTSSLSSVNSNSIRNNFNQIFVAGSKKSDLVAKLISQFQTLESVSSNISNGISTSCDKIYIVKTDLIEKYSMEPFAVKRTIRGSNFNKYWIDQKVDDFVVYTSNKFSESEIPHTLEYLRANKELLIKSSVEKKNGLREWYKLFRPREESDFVAPKILVRQTGDRIIAALDDTVGFYPINSVNIIRLQSKDLNYATVILGILNSSLIKFFYQEISQEGGRILAEVKPSRIKAIPIPNIEHPSEISRLVQQIQDIRQTDIHTDTSNIETQIDQLVYELYGLTEEEVGVVEGN